MFEFYYKDFNTLYSKLNQEILLNPKLMKEFSGTMGLLYPIHIKTPSTKCDRIDLGSIGYTAGKWSNLLSTYLGPDRHVLNKIKSLDIGQISGLSISIDFHRKTIGNGACILSLTLARKKRSKPWSEAFITFRSSETHNKLPVDLILISKLLDVVPDSNFEGVNLVLLQPFQNAMSVQPMAKFLWGIDLYGIKTSGVHRKYIDAIIDKQERYYDDRNSTVKQTSAGKRAIKLYRDYEDNVKLPSIKGKDLELI